MEVIALVGPSGSGKSHRSLAVAHDYAAELMIDDGLLIQGSRILAGISAKEQPTRVGAIKTALFCDPEHAREVRQVLADLKPRRLLVISTSRKMVLNISQRLNLPEPSIWLDITDIATPKEIARARQIRQQLGKHVIPVPAVELKPRFQGLLIEPLRTFLRRRHSPPGKAVKLWVEQTTVRPTFNSLGRFYISHNAVAQIAIYLATTAGLSNLEVKIDSHNSNLIINIEAAAPYGVSLPVLLRRIQKKVRTVISSMTALEVEAVNITIRTLTLKE